MPHLHQVPIRFFDLRGSRARSQRQNLKCFAGQQKRAPRNLRSRTLRSRPVGARPSQTSDLFQRIITCPICATHIPSATRHSAVTISRQTIVYKLTGSDQALPFAEAEDRRNNSTRTKAA